MNARSLTYWSLAFVVGTFVFSWYSVPAVAAVLGWFRWKKSPVLSAAASASLAWAVLLLVAAFRGPVGELVDRLSGVMGVPGLAVYGLTLLLPAVLAGSAAGLTGALRAGAGKRVRERGNG